MEACRDFKIKSARLKEHYTFRILYRLLKIQCKVILNLLKVALKFSKKNKQKNH